MNTYLRHTVISGLSYGLGFVLGQIMSRWIYDIDPVESLFFHLSLENVVGFLLLVIFALMISGGIAGAIGGLGLSQTDRSLSRRRLILASSFSTALSFGPVLFVMVLVLALIGFFNSADDLVNRIIPVVTAFGAIFGLLTGLLLGLLTVGRRFLWVSVAGTIGFGVGPDRTWFR